MWYNDYILDFIVQTHVCILFSGASVLKIYEKI